MSRAEVVSLIRSGARFAVTGHRRPDADALGSALGFAAILRALDKEVCVYAVDPVPHTLRYLEAAKDVQAGPPAGAFDACFIMDAAAEALVPALPPSLEGPVVLIDHHAAHDDYGDLVLREPDACATAVVVVRLMRALGMERIPTAAAPPLYAALVADTGGFRYATTDADTLRLGAELLDAGAEPWPTAYHLFEGWRPERMKLLGVVLDGIEVVHDGTIAILRVTRAMMREVGADDEMVEGMVNWGRTLDGVEVALLLWELEGANGPETKVSLRSAGRVDVAEVALALGGGGHRAASGANVRATLAETEARARAVLDPAVEDVRRG